MWKPHASPRYLSNYATEHTEDLLFGLGTNITIGVENMVIGPGMTLLTGAKRFTFDVQQLLTQTEIFSCKPNQQNYLLIYLKTESRPKSMNEYKQHSLSLNNTFIVSQTLPSTDS